DLRLQCFRCRWVNLGFFRVSLVQSAHVMCNFRINILQCLLELRFCKVPMLVVDAANLRDARILRQEST
ncbi:MAG: hypothetical protein ACRERE_12280, partial [Candidatus Entotheonellia bacterium]